MKIPPFYIGTTLLFWGMESNNLLLGVIIAVVLESCQFIKEKWTLSKDDFIRISDLTSVIFITAIGLILLNKEPITFFRNTTIWLPVILLPLVIAQLYSTNDKIVIGTQIGSKKKKKSYQHAPMDFSFYYVILALFATAAANSRSAYFFPGIAFLMGWLLFYNRGKSFKIHTFIATLVVVFAAGYFGFQAMEKSHHYLRKKSWEMMRSYYLNRFADPYKANIAYGSTGRLKQSGTIVIRVFSLTSPPDLLKEASYTNYNSAAWRNPHQLFDAAVLTAETEWELIPKPHPTGLKTTIEQNLPKEKGLLVRPAYSFRITSPNLFELERNKAGTLKALDSAPVVTTDFFYNRNKPVDDIPDQWNTFLPKHEKETLTKVAQTIWQIDDSKTAKLSKLSSYFSANFSYTLELQNRGRQTSLLANFLLSTKEGHCELFATATTLLLRTANIPTRYVTGFAVEEYSKLEGCYVVRDRHAHAWCEAYINGKWITVDNTPANWQDQDLSNRSFLEPVSDFLSFLKQKYKRFQIGSEQNYDTLLSIVIIILALILIYRIYRRLQLQKDEKYPNKQKRIFIPQDSPFTLLEEWLIEVAGERNHNEQMSTWLRRVCSSNQLPYQEILKLYQHHQKLRFDAEHFSEAEYQKLRDGVSKFLPSQ